MEEINCVVEVNGTQHYSAQSFGKNKVQTLVDYSKQMNRDSRLKKACNDFGLEYLEIPYTVKTIPEIIGLLSEYKSVEKVVFNGM